MKLHRFAFLVVLMSLTAGCSSIERPTWLEEWDGHRAEVTDAIFVGGHVRNLTDGRYEARGYFVPFSSDFPPYPPLTPDFIVDGEERSHGYYGAVPGVDLAPDESYTLVSPPLIPKGAVTSASVDPGHPHDLFVIHCPFKDASTLCEDEFYSTLGFYSSTLSDVTEHLLYDRLGEWEMPTIDIIDLACSHPLTSYEMTCTFGTWNWYDLDPATANLTARLRARSNDLFQVVEEWDVPFGAPLAHNDTRPYSIELGDAVEWVADYQTNDFYVEIVARRPGNAASMSHLMTHVLVHPVEELAR